MKTPDRCPGCYMPTDKITKECGGWAVIPTGYAGIELFCCPNCGIVCTTPGLSGILRTGKDLDQYKGQTYGHC